MILIRSFNCNLVWDGRRSFILKGYAFSFFLIFFFWMVSTEIQAQTVYKDVDPIAIGESTTLLAPVSTNSNTTITYTWTGGNPYVSLSRNGKQCTITGLSVGSTEVKCTLKCENSSSGTTYKYLVYYVTVIESSITGISLNYTSIDMLVGGIEQLSATVSPSDASQDVKWSVVSGSSVASVSLSGSVTAKAVGTAVIRATSKIDNSVYEDCTVTVTEPELCAGTWSGDNVTIRSNAIIESSLLPYGNCSNYTTMQLLYTPIEIGKSAPLGSIAFYVADPFSYSTSELKIYLGHKSGKFSNVSDYVTSSDLTLVYSGSPTLGQNKGWETLQFNEGTFFYNGIDNLVVVITKAASSNSSDLWYRCYTGSDYVLYRRSDTYPEYSDISNTEKVYLKSLHRPVVRFTITPTSIELNQTYKDMEVGTSFQLTASVSPSAASQSVTWSVVSGSTCASVSSSGLVTAKAVGTATIRATSTANSSVYKDCTVTVTEPALNDGDVFTASTIEGVEMTFKVTSAANRTCQVGNDWTLSINNSTNGFLTIPQTVKGYTVTKIGDGAFYECSGLTSITIPSSVTSIELSAFENCSNLTSITIPNSVTSIGDRAFYMCSNLMNITIPNSVIGIGEAAFSGCFSLTRLIVDAGNTVYDSRDNCNAIIETASNTLLFGCKNTTISNSVTNIRNRAFEGCSSLTSITIPNSVTSIGDFAFESCSSLTSITIPNSVISIGESAFERCSSLTSITIPNSVTSVGGYAFFGCVGFVSVTSLIENPFQIDESVFISYSGDDNFIYKQATLYVPAGKASIYRSTDGWNLFTNIVEMEPEDPTVFVAESTNGVPMAFKITDEDAKTCQIGNSKNAAINSNTDNKIVIPKLVNGYTVTAIADNAFANCVGIYSVYIPNSIQSIGENAFNGCASLSSVDSYIEEPFDIPESAFANIANDASLDVIYGTKEKYQALTGWNVFNRIDAETAIVNGLRYSVDVPEENGAPYTAWVKSSKWKDYSGDVVIPEVLTIEEESFTVVGIDDGAFAESQITSVTIPNTVRSIDDHAFYNCSALRSVTTYIMEPKNESDAFINIPTGATLYVPAGTKSLYEAAGGWNQFTNIVEMEPEDPTVFVAESTNGIPMTFKITDEDTKTCQIGTGNGAAISASISDVIVLPQTANGYAVTSIAANAFAGTGIGEVYIPKSIKSIGEKAFYGCARLGDVNSYIEEPFDIPESAFAGIPSDVYFTILYGTKDKYLAAEGWSVFSRIYDDVAVVDGIRYSVNGAVPIEEGEDAYTAWVHRPSKWDKYEGDIVIPEILTIGEESFTVEGIDDGAFAKSQITSVTIPSTVNYIDDRAFSNCQLLQSVTSYIMEPEDESDAFVNIPTGATLYVPNGTKSLYEAAGGWNQFTNIVEMEPDAWWDFISDGIFYRIDTSPKTEGLDVALYVTHSQEKNGYSGNIVIPTTVTNEGRSYVVEGIGEGAFAEMENLTSVEIPNTVVYIGEEAFVECANLESVVIPNSVISIGENAFGDCEKLSAIHIPEHLSEISAKTFKWCKSLTTVEIPASVTSIGQRAFSNCDNLTSIISYISTPFAIDLSTFGIYDDNRNWIANPNATLYVPFGTKALYMATEGWKEFANIVELKRVDGLCYVIDNANDLNNSIGEQVFTPDTEIAVVIADTGNKVYSGDVVIPSFIEHNGKTYAVEAINSKAFKRAPITSVSFPTSLRVIGEQAFDGCEELSEVVIPKGVCYIFDTSFAGCTHLTTVTLPSTLINIGMDAFSESHGSITTINCNLTKPFGIDKWTFGSEDANCEDYWNPYVYENATLYVPYGTKELYAATEGWNLFQNIVEVGFEVTDISQMDNVLYVDDAEGIADGRMTFYVKMKNSVVAKGFTFNLGIPEGFSVAKNLDGKIDVSLYKAGGRIDADSNVEFEGYFVSDGSLYVNAYVNGMDAFKKHDGAMLRIRLLIPKDTPVGSYPITISNWSISDDGGDTWPKGERPSLTFPLVVAEKVRGDANGDAKDKTKEASENVDVNSADFVKIVNFIFGLPHEGLDKTAADANGDGVVNATDLTVIADMKRKAAASSRAVKENVPTEAE